MIEIFFTRFNLILKSLFESWIPQLTSFILSNGLTLFVLGCFLINFSLRFFNFIKHKLM